MDRSNATKVLGALGGTKGFGALGAFGTGVRGDSARGLCEPRRLQGSSTGAAARPAA